MSGLVNSGDERWDYMAYAYNYNISFWFMPTADASSTSGTHSAIIFEVQDSDGSTPNGVKISYVDGSSDSEKLVVSHGDGSSYIDTTVDYDLDHDTWYHICIGYDYSQKDLEVYINGTLEYTNTNFARTDNGGGDNILLCDGDFTGNITQFIVWSGNNTPDDSWGIERYSKKLYNNGYGVNPQMLFRKYPTQIHAYWPLNENHCSTGTDGIVDMSTYGNHLTATNMVQSDFESTELPNGLQNTEGNVSQFQLNFDGNSPTTYTASSGSGLTLTNFDDQHAYANLSYGAFYRPEGARDFSISIWFKSDYSGSLLQTLLDFSGNQLVNGESIGSDANMNFRIGLLGLKPYFAFKSHESSELHSTLAGGGATWADEGGTAPSGSFSSNTWSMFTITAELNGSGDDDILKIYRNTTLDGTLTHNIPFSASSSTDYDMMTIGRIRSNYADQEAGSVDRLNGEAGNFKGAISQIGVWDNKALSASEITELYKSGEQANWLGPNQSCRSDLNYYWVFGDGPEFVGQTQDADGTRLNSESTVYGGGEYVIKCVPGTKGARHLNHPDDNIYLNPENYPTWSEQ
tara:strand:- start:452 stop:2173 length:1722 start_codon:yes stop_codon:yes gene_type:complete